MPQDEQAVPVPTSPETVSVAEAAKRVEIGGLHFGQEMQLTLLVFAFAFVSLLFLFLIANSGRASPFVLRIYVITIIVFGALAVVSASYGTDQIAPIIGLFGTIAGYVLGRSDRNNEPPQSPPT